MVAPVAAAEQQPVAAQIVVEQSTTRPVSGNERTDGVAVASESGLVFAPGSAPERGTALVPAPETASEFAVSEFGTAKAMPGLKA